MARPMRVEYENACYHVINRGNRREKVFNAERDYLLFLEIAKRFSISISGLNMAIHRFKSDIKNDKKIRHMILNINKIIQLKCKNV